MAVFALRDLCREIGERSRVQSGIRRVGARPRLLPERYGDRAEPHEDGERYHGAHGGLLECIRKEPASIS
jgi:hypothetical protein